ncbi:glycosyltransferase family 4 protein [Phreatobacter sp. AB_2022a]|uniref:glycosyltransferase family 4 protein n=1 Tax=Phreatobacter sp. AB_2022a TaxID=3003134 RepID=UPI00228735E4|nr:glycosyltransferase family 4 protein [Phreatobacter sp. AB_2022a]MCZ0737956.1 glycosyltransferase family 4 protein [Phreatobacter sp. AB_2022a]
MRIAQIAPLHEAVPPRLYGGTERIVSYLTEGLVARGHEVTLFASADTQTTARLVPVRERALRFDPRPLKSGYAAHLSMLDEVRRQADAFDILHFHIDLVHFPFFEARAGRTVTTLHGRLDLTDLAEAYARWAEYPLVSISDAQRRFLPDANWLRTVHHGVPADLFRLSPGAGDYLAFLGRISPEKRPDRAITVAARTGMPLKIAAKIDPADQAYWDEIIAPLIAAHANVAFIGEIGDADKSAFLGGAAALLFPIDWPEPFGLVMIEALGCGTPVIAWRNGSVAEIIEDGVTGYVVSSEDEAVAAVAELGRLDRAAIRRAFEQRFSTGIMTAAYEDLFKGLLRGEAVTRAA